MSLWGTRHSKYRAKRTEFDGYSFQSQAERELYRYIQALEQLGELKLIQTQKRVKLLENPDIVYIPDFYVQDLKLGEDVFLEMKGMETTDWLIKRKLWIHFGPGLLRVYGHNSRGVFLKEELRGKSSA